MNDRPSIGILGLIEEEEGMRANRIDILAGAVDAMLGIQPKKTAVTGPDLLALLRVAHLRRQIARSRAALGAEAEVAIWERLAPLFSDTD